MPDGPIEVCTVAIAPAKNVAPMKTVFARPFSLGSTEASASAIERAMIATA